MFQTEKKLQAKQWIYAENMRSTLGNQTTAARTTKDVNSDKGPLSGPSLRRKRDGSPASTEDSKKRKKDDSELGASNYSREDTLLEMLRLERENQKNNSKFNELLDDLMKHKRD